MGNAMQGDEASAAGVPDPAIGPSTAPIQGAHHGFGLRSQLNLPPASGARGHGSGATWTLAHTIGGPGQQRRNHEVQADTKTMANNKTMQADTKMLV